MFSIVKSDTGRIGLFLVIACLSTLNAAAVPVNPTYSYDFYDAVTGDNAFYDTSGDRYWDVDPGADSYQNDYYERPTVQTYQTVLGKYAAEEYFEYLDIVKARMGYDSDYMYVSIELYGLDKSTKDGVDDEQGLVERYGFRLGLDTDGRNSLLLVSDQPALKNNPNTAYGQVGTFGYYDADGDVGGAAQITGNGGPTGLTVTKEDNPEEEHGMTGYEEEVIADGKLKSDGSTGALWVRLDPNSPNIVEFAFDYSLFDLTMNDLMNNLLYLEFEAIKGGAKDPKNYLWNDKYNESEAGSPNPGIGGLSEFGTQGLGNIYELDTLRATFDDPNDPEDPLIPEPASLAMVGLGLSSLAFVRWRRKAYSR